MAIGIAVTMDEAMVMGITMVIGLDIAGQVARRIQPEVMNCSGGQTVEALMVARRWQNEVTTQSGGQTVKALTLARKIENKVAT